MLGWTKRSSPTQHSDTKSLSVWKEQERKRAGRYEKQKVWERQMVLLTLDSLVYPPKEGLGILNGTGFTFGNVTVLECA